MIWTLAAWSNEGCIVCESGFFFFFCLAKMLTASPGPGMSLAFNQKQHLTPDQPAHTRARAASQHYNDAIISEKTPTSDMKHRSIV